MKLVMLCKPELESIDFWKKSSLLKRYDRAWIDDVDFSGEEFDEMYRLAQEGYPFEMAWIGIELNNSDKKDIQFYRAFPKNLFTETNSYADKNIDHVKQKCIALKDGYLRRERKIAWLKKYPKLNNKIYSLSQSCIYICHIDLYSKLSSLFLGLDKIDIYADLESVNINKEWVGINSSNALADISKTNPYVVFKDADKDERDLVSIGSLIYKQETLKSAKDFNITSESFNMNYSGDFIVSRAFVEFCEKNKISSFRYEPVLIEGTPIEQEYSKKLKSLFAKLEKTPDVFYKGYRMSKLFTLLASHA